jgi:hypothetical protein
MRNVTMICTLRRDVRETYPKSRSQPQYLGPVIGLEPRIEAVSRY